MLLTVPFFLAFHDEPGNGPKTINNSAPSGAGGNGPYPCLNMELLGHLPLDEIGGGPSNVLGSDCWGWTDPQTGKEYAIAGMTQSTAFVDISDPRDLKYLGTLPTTTGNSAWRDMKVYANHVYIVSDGNGQHGMQVFDLTQLRTADPNNPQTFSNTALYTGVSSSHNIAINEDTGYAYIVGSNRASGGLHIVDLSNPSVPVEAGNFSADGYTHDAQIVSYTGPDNDYTGREIAFVSNEDTLTIVDVTNKNNPTQISRNGYPNDAYTHQSWLTEDHRFVYLCDELDEDGINGTVTHVWDCLDLDSPIYLGAHNGTTRAIDHNLYIKDDYIYLASYSAGLRILEIDSQAPLALNEVAFFDTYPTDTDTDFDGAWSCYPFYESGVVFVNDRQNGVFVVRINPLQFNFPSGTPELIQPAGGVTEFTVEVTGFAGTPQPGTGQLHVDRGNGFEVFPMNEASPNVYEGVFPATNCGDMIDYYISAEASDGSRLVFPYAAPDEVFTAVSGNSTSNAFTDDFETNQGWNVTGDATDGLWERAAPNGDGTRGDPTLDGDGSGQCYVTGNGAGNTDVDGGTTTLTSPIFDATGGGNTVAATLCYWRWYSNDVGNAPNSDIFEVDISNDGGNTWNVVEVVGPGGNEVSGGWFYKEFLIGNFVTPTDQMQVRFRASDLGNGSVVEAAIDGVCIDIVNCQSTIFAPVENVNIVNGLFGGGNIASLADSDNVDYSVRKNSSQLNNLIQVQMTGTSHTSSPSALSITVEGSVFARANIVQNVQLYNFDTDTYETVDSRNAGRFGDVTVNADATGDLSRFVQPGTLAVDVRLRFEAPSARAVFTANTDQVFWTITD